MAELWLFISAPPIGPRSNSSISPTHCPLKMCDMDSIPLAEHYWHAAYRAFLGRVPSRGAIVNRSNEAVATQVPLY
jgi:hypothetical protein